MFIKGEALATAQRLNDDGEWRIISKQIADKQLFKNSNLLSEYCTLLHTDVPKINQCSEAEVFSKKFS